MMRCILCKSVSDNSTSVEHIIPESLGNQEHVLPPGWVCDSCNNYVALKIEKPFLDSVFGRHSRFEMKVPNKKGRVPHAIGLHLQSNCKVELAWTPNDGLSMGAANEAEESRWVQSVLAGKKGTVIVPVVGMPIQCDVTSRFVAKTAIEIFALRLLSIKRANDEIVDMPELDEIRSYVRRGRPRFVWPIHIRRLYSPDQFFPDEPNGQPYQVLHEFDILVVGLEFYAVLAIFGVEFTINLGGPELAGFQHWLTENGNRSPLYCKDH